MIYPILMKLQLPEVMVVMQLQLLVVMQQQLLEVMVMMRLKLLEVVVMVQLQRQLVTVMMQLQLLLVMVMMQLLQKNLKIQNVCKFRIQLCAILLFYRSDQEGEGFEGNIRRGMDQFGANCGYFQDQFI